LAAISLLAFVALSDHEVIDLSQATLMGGEAAFRGDSLVAAQDHRLRGNKRLFLPVTRLRLGRPKLIAKIRRSSH
jgi:hypothetical protein